MGLGVSSSRYSAIPCLPCISCISACIIVCRLATGDIRPSLPYLSFGCRPGPGIHGSGNVMVSLWHFAILTGSNGCLRYSDSWIWPFVGSRHLAIYMACPSYHSSSFVCEFSEQLHIFCPPPSPVYSFISTPGLCRLDIGSYLALGHGICLSRPLFACGPGSGIAQS